jgi:transposase-like protein
MAKRRSRKASAESRTSSDKPESKGALPTAAAPAKTARASRRGEPTRQRRRATAKAAVRGRTATSSRPGRKPRARRRFSPAERSRILATARRERLTSAQVAKRFKISPITYNLWRKKSRAGTRRKSRMVATGRVVGKTLGRAVNLADAIRHEIRAHIGHLLPEILKSEVGRALSGSTTRRGRRRN